MVNTEEQVLLAQVISHLPLELRQRLAARQLTGRLPKARKLPAHGGPDIGLLQCHGRTWDLWR
jgi:hypothetical protein